VGLFIIAVFFLVRFLIQQGRGGQGVLLGGALEILKKRYARGEINKEEFEQKKKDLSS
jgi:putative membrane protein